MVERMPFSPEHSRAEVEPTTELWFDKIGRLREWIDGLALKISSFAGGGETEMLRLSLEAVEVFGKTPDILKQGNIRVESMTWNEVMSASYGLMRQMLGNFEFEPVQRQVMEGQVLPRLRAKPEERRFVFYDEFVAALPKLSPEDQQEWVEIFVAGLVGEGESGWRVWRDRELVLSTTLADYILGQGSQEGMMSLYQVVKKVSLESIASGYKGNNTLTHQVQGLMAEIVRRRIEQGEADWGVAEIEGLMEEPVARQGFWRQFLGQLTLSLGASEAASILDPGLVDVLLNLDQPAVTGQTRLALALVDSPRVSLAQQVKAAEILAAGLPDEGMPVGSGRVTQRLASVALNQHLPMEVRQVAWSFFQRVRERQLRERVEVVAQVGGWLPHLLVVKEERVLAQRLLEAVEAGESEFDFVGEHKLLTVECMAQVERVKDAVARLTQHVARDQANSVYRHLLAIYLGNRVVTPKDLAETIEDLAQRVASGAEIEGARGVVEARLQVTGREPGLRRAEDEDEYKNSPMISRKKR